MTSTFTDDALLDYIKAGGAKRQQAIAFIYREKKLKNRVVHFVTHNSGSKEEGIGIFHDGIIALDHNIRSNKYRGEGNLKAYLFSICRFLWLNKIKRDRRMVYTEETAELDEVSYDTPETLSLDDEKKEILRTLLSRLGTKCEKILEMWKLSYSMEEIAQEVGLKNAGVARRQRYLCYQKLLEIVDQQPNLRTLLK